MLDRLASISSEYKAVSIVRQCELLGVPRSSYYYSPIPESDDNLLLMREIDEIFLEHSSYGRRSMTASLRNQGYEVNEKRVARLMKLMGLQAIYPKPKKKLWEKKYGKFPYLVNKKLITSSNQVWGTDITYIPLKGGFLYLVAVLDLYSRYVLSWELSNSLESNFCIEAVSRAFMHGIPQILNSDQGVQFTSENYIKLLKNNDVKISMSGKGRCWDNIFVERFWRTLKYEEVYLNDYSDYEDAYEGIGIFMESYNTKRVHSSLKYQTPKEVYFAA